MSDIKSKYLAFVLDAPSRAELLKRCPPKYNKVIAHHVTIEFNVTQAGLNMLADYAETGHVDARVVAYAGDDKVDCVMVNLNGTCKRSDNSFYHVTLSCSPTGKPVDSNACLKQVTPDWLPTAFSINGALKLINK